MKKSTILFLRFIKLPRVRWCPPQRMMSMGACGWKTLEYGLGKYIISSQSNDSKP